jgi:thioredoxin
MYMNFALKTLIFTAHTLIMAIIKSSRIYLLAITIILCSLSGKKSSGYKNLDINQYNALVNDKEQLVLVDFYAPWCKSCIQMSPHIDKIAQMYQGRVKVVRINVDENKTMSQVLNIKYLPTVYLYKNKQAVWNFVGYIDRYPLTVYINRHLDDE